MNPAIKRFDKRYGPIADVISRADIDQVDREAIAVAMGEALTGQPDFRPDLFRLIAKDPLVACAGYTLRETGDHVACPHGRELRIAMHDRDAPDGRNIAWTPRLPEGIRCVSCGSMHFSAEYQRNVLAETA